jgi:hypothetical protein
MIKGWPILAGIIIIALGAWVLIGVKGCGDPKEQILQDSLNIEKQRNDTITTRANEWKQKHDSITLAKHIGDSLDKHKIDSLTTVCTSLKTKFLSTRDTIANLHDRLNVAFSTNDTGRVYKIADSLNNELVAANNQLFSWQISRDSLSSAQLSEIERLQGVITTLQGQISQFTALLTDCTNNAAALAKTGQKAAKKAKLASLWAKLGTGIAAVAIGIILIVK